MADSEFRAGFMTTDINNSSLRTSISLRLLLAANTSVRVSYSSFSGFYDEKNSFNSAHFEA